jgi:putative nucleotidyltransferase with HDIG domain
MKKKETGESRKILIVDDEPCVLGLLSRLLTMEGYTCVCANNGRQALEMFRAEPIQVAILDILMPGVNGISLLKRVKQLKPFTEVVMITGAADVSLAIEAMRHGARDYVLKPFNLNTLLSSIQRAFKHRRQLLESKEYQDCLEVKIREKTSELIEQNLRLQLLIIHTVQSLVHTLEAKDTHTQGHSKRVAFLAVLIARRLGFAEEDGERLRLAGILHDIGKIGIREACLNKPGKLSVDEFEEVKQHPLISQRILEPIEEFQDIIPNIKHHHERFDGRGYPMGLKGDTIPLVARILAVADCYDAMTSDRPYRSALNSGQAMEEIRKNAGKQFDPDIVSVFSELKDELGMMTTLGTEDAFLESSFLSVSNLTMDM